jgi:hypothetical protein
MATEMSNGPPRSAYPKGYSSWVAMRSRTRNSNATDYKYYGGKGIVVDPSWDDFSVFLRDMGERPEGHTLDRIDNSKGYCKENCRWATRAEQQHNTRRTKLKPANIPQIRRFRAGTNLSVKELGQVFQIDPSTVYKICAGKRWKEII